MGEALWPGIRPGAVRQEVYNEALMVYLLDRKNLKPTMESDADFESGFSLDESEADPDLLALAKKGDFLSYELMQDDDIVVEIVVGAPLTAAELSSAKWLEPQQGFLRLPSGKLQIHSANTLPIDDDDPEEKPGKFSAEPGDYVVTLYRLDWDAMEVAGLLVEVNYAEDDEGRPWDGPQEIIVLTPAAEAGDVPTNQCYIPYPA